MNTERYRNQKQVSEISYYAYKERIQKEFILATLNEMPLDKLKSLVNFKEIDPRKGECNSAYEFFKKEELLRNSSIELIADFNL